MNVCVCCQSHGIFDGSGEGFRWVVGVASLTGYLMALVRGLDECMCVLPVSRDI